MKKTIPDLRTFVVALILSLLSAVFDVGTASAGSLWTWGLNSNGQIGDGTISNSRFVPFEVPVEDVSKIVAEGGVSYAIISDGTVWAWGRNDQGQLGNGSSGSNNPIPSQIPGLSGVVDIASDGRHTLALKSDGSVWGWGNNHLGPLGRASCGCNYSSNCLTPERIPGLTGIRAIAAGIHYSIALKSNGTVWAMGWDDMLGIGVHGDASNYNTCTPYNPYSPDAVVQIPGLNDIIAITAGLIHSAALKSDGTVWTWGSNGVGEIGDGTYGYGDYRYTPVQMAGGVTAVTAGGGYTVALKSDGTVWLTGGGEMMDPEEYEFPYTDTAYFCAPPGPRLTPVRISGIDGVIAIATGRSLNYTDVHFLALKADGTVWGWGRNASGQLGNGEGGTYLPVCPPIQVASGISNVRTIEAGESFSMAIGSAQCQ